MVPQACPAGRPRRAPSLPDEVHLPDIQRLFWGAFRVRTVPGAPRGRVDLALQSDGSASIPPPHQPSPAGSASATPPQGGSDVAACIRRSSITPPLRGSRREGGARSRAGGGQTRRPSAQPVRVPGAARARPRRSPCASQAQPVRVPGAARARPVRVPLSDYQRHGQPRLTRPRRQPPGAPSLTHASPSRFRLGRAAGETGRHGMMPPPGGTREERQWKCHSRGSTAVNS